MYYRGWVSTFASPSSFNPNPRHAKGPGSPEHDSSRTTMIREGIAINGIVHPLEPERDIPALNIDPITLGIISARWAQVYLAGMQRHEKKYASSIRQIEQRRKRAIALLRFPTEASQEETVAEVEGDGWSVAWALDDADECPPPSSLVARCDTAEALALARSAAATTKRKRNARLAGTSLASLSLLGTSKRHEQDSEEKVKNAVPASDLLRRLSQGHGASTAAAATAAVGVQPQVVVAT